MQFNFPSIPPASQRRASAAGILLLCSLIPGEALACACGCSVFDVGSTSLLPKEGDHGGAVYFEWDHSDQNHELERHLERRRRQTTATSRLRPNGTSLA